MDSLLLQRAERELMTAEDNLTRLNAKHSSLRELQFDMRRRIDGFREEIGSQTLLERYKAELLQAELLEQVLLEDFVYWLARARLASEDAGKL
jgi:hypothetical protein